ncbi:hypothetical protein FACS1894120_3500 [Clostridia bacterium]|nr:hypothetical protein FACS1894120_3500 [Clostridia bacterium]
MLDISNLAGAVNALSVAVRLAKKYEDKRGDTENDGDLEYAFARSAVIQNFEVAYEASWKFMKRWLELNVGEDSVKGVVRREFFRIAAENLLIDDTVFWFHVHDSRNKTSHIYHEDVADEVYKTAKEFAPVVQAFVSNMEKRL